MWAHPGGGDGPCVNHDAASAERERSYARHAAAVPVIPFALFSLATARLVSLSVTFALLVFLGIGRGMIGHRRILPTIAETIGIAAAAAIAGLAIGKLIS